MPDTNVLRTTRPLLDLPDDHPARRHLIELRKHTSLWQPATVPGCWFKIVADHREAIRTLQLLGQDQPGRILRRPIPADQSVHFTTNFVTAAGEALGLMASWCLPDEDDPNRIEGGWSVFLVVGPLVQAEAIEKTVAAAARRAADGGEFVIFSP